MRKPRDLSRVELIEIVAAVQKALYLDLDAEHTQVWNPDKPWAGAEICDQLAEVLTRHQLAPDAVIPVLDGAT